jgi:hypothetical protein
MCTSSITERPFGAYHLVDALVGSGDDIGIQALGNLAAMP